MVIKMTKQQEYTIYANASKESKQLVYLFIQVIYLLIVLACFLLSVLLFFYLLVLVCCCHKFTDNNYFLFSLKQNTTIQSWQFLLFSSLFCESCSFLLLQFLKKIKFYFGLNVCVHVLFDGFNLFAMWKETSQNGMLYITTEWNNYKITIHHAGYSKKVRNCLEKKKHWRH